LAPSANSYGTAAQVAALTRRYTTNGVYVDPVVGPPAVAGTNPSLTTVEGWIDSISSTLNVILAGAGFSIPITQETAKAAIAAIVVEAVADLCHAANSAGRFYTERALERGVAPMRVIRQEMSSWVEDQADGLELIGAVRTRASTAGILYRDTDEGGDPTSPIFQRNGFGNRFNDWSGD
jgi:hypothetical protein